MTTGYLNLRKHLARWHSAAYNKAIVENNWDYRHSSQLMSGKLDTVEARKRSLPPFTQASFIEYVIDLTNKDSSSDDKEH